MRVLVGSWQPLSASVACAAVTIITAGPYCCDYGGSFDGWIFTCSLQEREHHHLVDALSVLRRECRQHHHLRDDGVGACVSVRVLVGSWHPLSASVACSVCGGHHHHRRLLLLLLQRQL